MRLLLGGRTVTAAVAGSGDGILAGGTSANPTVEGLLIQGSTVGGLQDGVHVEDAPGARVTCVTSAGNGFGIFLMNYEAYK